MIECGVDPVTVMNHWTADQIRLISEGASEYLGDVADARRKAMNDGS